MIEIKDVMKSFENKNVLNHLNVTISSGSIFGLIGPNELVNQPYFIY